MGPSGQSKTVQRPLVAIGMGFLTAFSLLYIVFLFSGRWSDGDAVIKAKAVLSGESPVSGSVTFLQASRNGPVIITGELKNMDPSSKRGFHIHQSGDLSNRCLSTGAHYNPFGKHHGARTDVERHLGDLGNIEVDEFGIASFTIEDDRISLHGPTSIIGRAVVVHSGTDDLGRGNNAESLRTGNAGGRAACGIIGVV